MSPANPQMRFEAAVPRVAYATDNLAKGISRQNRSAALEARYIQPNARYLIRYLIFDVDRPGAYFAACDAMLPPPHWIAENRENGRAHLAYELADPVPISDLARRAPMRFLAAIKCGFTRRLGADRGFVGLITKNPVHSHWRTEWGRSQPYQLGELADWLFPNDVLKFNQIERVTGLGRNCSLFDKLRIIAYRAILPQRSDGGSRAAFIDYLTQVGITLNSQFTPPLAISEIRATVRSVANWTWRRFDDRQFSQIQARRGKMGGLISGEVRAARRDARADVARDLLRQLVPSTNAPPEGGISDMASCPKECQGEQEFKIGGDHGPAP